MLLGKFNTEIYGGSQPGEMQLGLGLAHWLGDLRVTPDSEHQRVGNQPQRVLCAGKPLYTDL